MLKVEYTFRLKWSNKSDEKYEGTWEKSSELKNCKNEIMIALRCFRNQLTVSDKLLKVQETEYNVQWLFN